MRIAWFTPFSPRSAIGHYSAAILEHLTREHAVVVFTPPCSGPDSPRPTSLPLVTIADTPSPELLETLTGFDAVVYNIGNYPPYHEPIYETAVRHPGVVVLHDLVLRDFFMSHTYRIIGRAEYYPELLGYAHGPEAEAHGREVIAGREQERFGDPRRLQYPLFLPVLRGALGVVVHSAYALGHVAKTGLPAVKLDFPLFGPAGELASAPRPARPPDGTVRVLSFGVLNANKLVHATVQAIASSPTLRKRVRFEVIGAGDDSAYRRQVEGLIRDNRLDRVVQLTGWQPDDKLQAALLGADVVVNLRNPHMGESSASLLDSLAAGIPTLVWDHGFFAEFPDEVVMKVKAEAEIRPALERLVASPDLRTRMGQAAREHARKRFDTVAYCTGLMAFLERMATAAPFAQLADRVAAIMLEMGCTPDDIVTRRLGAELDGWSARTAPYPGPTATG